jgi:hypothetical protein
VKRVLFWSAPFLTVAAIIGVLGYRALVARRTPGLATPGEVAQASRAGEGRRVAPRPAWFHAPDGRKAHGTPFPSSAARAGGGAVTAIITPELAEGRPRSTGPIDIKPEEAVVRRKLEPLVAGHKDTDLRFVVCEAFTAPPADEGSANEEPSAFDSPPKDPGQPVCRARVKARDRETLSQVVHEASTLYQGHLAVEVREHMEAFTGRWYEADLRVDTDDAQTLPSDI